MSKINLTIIEKADVIELDVVEKFNPYHDKLGRFTTAGGATVFTWRTKDGSKQHLADKAIGRAKEQHAAQTAAEKKPNKPDWSELEELLRTHPNGRKTRALLAQKEAWEKKYGKSSDNDGKKSADDKPKNYDRAKVLKTITSQEQKNRHLEHEEAYCYDKEGKVLFHNKGNETSVYFSKSDEAKMKDAILTHNHPSHSPFSEGDINTFVKGQLYEMRATTVHGKVYSIRQTENSNPTDGEKFRETFNLLMQQSERKAREEVDRGAARLLFDLGQFTEKDLDDEFCDILARELNKKMGDYANMYGYKYEVTEMEG